MWLPTGRRRTVGSEAGPTWRRLARRGGHGCRRQHGGQADGGSTHQGAADDVHGSRFPVLDPENSAMARGHTEPRTMCLDGGNSPDLEVSRLVVSPHWRTIHGCGPAPESHRLPLTGSTTTARMLPAYGSTGGSKSQPLSRCAPLPVGSDAPGRSCSVPVGAYPCTVAMPPLGARDETTWTTSTKVRSCPSRD